MAARKKATVPATTGSNLPASTSWEDRMRALARRAVERDPVTGGANYISIRSGEFHYGDEVLGDVLDVVVLEFSFDNAYYGGRPFDPDVRDSPDCFAIALDESSLVPHADSSNPQAKTCDECWANEFGSDERGRGKACSNKRRLAVLAVDESNGYIVAEDSEMAILKISPSSIKHWKSYVTKLDRVTGLPPAGVITRLELEPIKGQSGSMVIPSLIQAVEDQASQEAIIGHLDALGDALLAPYTQVDEDERTPAKRAPAKRAPAKRAPAKRAPAKRAPTSGGDAAPAGQGRGRGSRRKF